MIWISLRLLDCLGHLQVDVYVHKAGLHYMLRKLNWNESNNLCDGGRQRSVNLVMRHIQDPVISIINHNEVFVMTQGLLSWWQGQAYDGRSCGPGRQGHVMAQAQCEPKTYYEYFESFLNDLKMWCQIQNRGEREFPFSAIPGNTSLKFPFPH